MNTKISQFIASHEGRYIGHWDTPSNPHFQKAFLFQQEDGKFHVCFWPPSIPGPDGLKRLDCIVIESAAQLEGLRNYISAQDVDFGEMLQRQ